MTKLMLILVILIRISNVFSQINENDSLAIRAILDSNGLKSTPVHSVVDSIKNGRIFRLRISISEFTVLTSEIGHLDQLESVHLYNSSVTSLPPEIGKLTNLIYLSLSGNKLTSLPPEIGHLAQLEELGLDRNNLSSLPPEIGKLTNLSRLTMQNNRLNNLPIETCDLTPVHYLNLENNQLDINTLSQEILAWADKYDPDWRDTQSPLFKQIKILIIPKSYIAVHRAISCESLHQQSILS